MKANGITCTDYMVQDGQLTLWLTDTTMQDVLDMERSIVRIETDDGAQVDVCPGYENVVSVLYEPATGIYRATFSRQEQEGIGAVLDALAADNTTLHNALQQAESDSKLLRAQLTAATDRQEFIEDCIAEMAMQVYAE